MVAVWVLTNPGQVSWELLWSWCKTIPSSQFAFNLWPKCQSTHKRCPYLELKPLKGPGIGHWDSVKCSPDRSFQFVQLNMWRESVMMASVRAQPKGGFPGILRSVGNLIRSCDGRIPPVWSFIHYICSLLSQWTILDDLKWTIPGNLKTSIGLRMRTHIN